MEMCFGDPKGEGWEIWIRGDQLHILVNDFRKELLRLRKLKVKNFGELDFWVSTLLDELQRLYALPQTTATPSDDNLIDPASTTLVPPTAESSQRRSSRSPSRPLAFDQAPFPRVLNTEVVGKPPGSKVATAKPTPSVSPSAHNSTRTAVRTSFSPDPPPMSPAASVPSKPKRPLPRRNHPSLTKPFVPPIMNTNLKVPHATLSPTDGGKSQYRVQHGLEYRSDNEPLFDADVDDAFANEPDVFDNDPSESQAQDRESKGGEEGEYEVDSQEVNAAEDDYSDEEEDEGVEESGSEDDDPDQYIPKRSISRKVRDIVTVEDSDEVDDDDPIWVNPEAGPRRLRKHKAAKAQAVSSKARKLKQQSMSSARALHNHSSAQASSSKSSNPPAGITSAFSARAHSNSKRKPTVEAAKPSHSKRPRIQQLSQSMPHTPDTPASSAQSTPGTRTTTETGTEADTDQGTPTVEISRNELFAHLSAQ
ncbi:hypothetical protein QFC22_006346 [Naganishia vaughanmartiniae]|uniref:Uncharacterized protein n=1 Tax=Naganishia vaughanmartiniae TaxID=1424756 RepID=A0ACC2WP32_9TREE|nr:hypothetical protein QFC22_006346 [Naganishia vaughanmartiniae]